MERYGENKYTINDILADPHKGMNMGGNQLSTMYRQILFDRDIGPKRFDVLLRKYLNNPYNGIEDTNTARQNHRGNLMKELANPNMTWNVFLKAMRVLDIRLMELQLYACDTNNITSKHSLVVENFPAYVDPLTDIPDNVRVEGLPSMVGNNTMTSTLEKTDIKPMTTQAPVEQAFNEAAERIKDMVRKRKQEKGNK